MPHATTTYTDAVALLAGRLQDSSEVYFGAGSTDELNACLDEALRFWQTLTATYKAVDTFYTSFDQPYYDLASVCQTQFGYTVTDVQIASEVLSCLLEPPLGPAWTGTGQFTFSQLKEAIQNRLDKFLGDSGVVVTQVTLAVTAGGEHGLGFVTLPDGTLDVRRAAWIDANGAVFPLGRSDEEAAMVYDPAFQTNQSDLPVQYSVFVNQPEVLRLSPPPSQPGSLDLLVVAAGPALNLDTAAPVLLSIPDDLSWAIKWGALADLLGSDGPCRDAIRAAYCEQRYSEGVQLAKLYPSILMTDLVLKCQDANYSATIRMTDSNGIVTDFPVVFVGKCACVS